MKDFNTFMYDHTLHHGKEHFFHYCLQAFSAEKTSKRHIKECIKINGKEMIVIPEKVNMLSFKMMKKK